MRRAVCIAFLAFAVCLLPAMAQDKLSPEKDAEKALTQQLIQKQLEVAGLTDVHVSPQVHVAQGKDQDGNVIVMVIDPESGAVIRLPTEPSTTGSGSEDEGAEEHF
jgi:hypothetical protein